ncbi:MAG TPA: hypothetical protein VFA07_01370 [Chthonomonadaceae bacterium]|nr:hypothetical protein [Chthonomonadaceae bacterium]
MPLQIKTRSRFVLALAGAAVLSAAVAGNAQHPSAPRKPAAGMVPVAKVTPPPGLAGGKSSNQSDVDVSGKGVSIDASTHLYRGRDMRFYFPDEKRTVTGDTGSYNDQTKIIDAEGHIVIDDPKHRITGDKAHVENGKQKLAIISSNVVAVIKPDQQPAGSSASPGEKEDVGSARQHGATITCDRLEDYFRKNYIVMHGHFVGKQNFRDKDGKEIERTLTAEHAEYDGKKEILLLYPPVDEHDNEGRQIHFDSLVTVGTHTGAETLEANGPFHMVTPYDNSSEEEGPEPGPPPAKEGSSGGPSKPPGKP